jgi:hypothetical protein
MQAMSKMIAAIALNIYTYLMSPVVVKNPTLLVFR